MQTGPKHIYKCIYIEGGQLENNRKPKTQKRQRKARFEMNSRDVVVECLAKRGKNNNDDDDDQQRYYLDMNFVASGRVMSFLCAFSVSLVRSCVAFMTLQCSTAFSIPLKTVTSAWFS